MINWRSIGEYDQPKVCRLSVVYMLPVKIGGTGFGRSLLARGASGLGDY